MRAWVLTEHGPPAKAFQLKEVPKPVPSAGQVLIRSEGFGLNFADTMARQGLYREAPPLPSIIGYEVVGRVEAAGEQAPDDLMGKRVVAVTRFGGYGGWAVTDHRAAQVIPEDMDLGVALCLTTQYVTAWYASQYACRLREGQRVLVHSAAGGVGQGLVQMALNAGCEVFGVGSGVEKMEHLKRMGAHHAIDRKAAPYHEQLKRVLGDGRLDVSFNAVAGKTFKQDMQLIGSGGTVVLYGGAARSGRSGPFATLRFAWDMGLVVPIFLMMRSKSLVGINMLKLGDHRPELMAQCMREVVDEATEGRLKPHVHEVLPIQDLPKAHELLSSGKTIGKVAVQWDRPQ